MRATRRLRLAALIAATVAALLTSPATAGSPVPGNCPDGTNWDNVTHTCR